MAEPMKPGDFFLGVLDFFAILLPGSLATWLAIQYIPASSLRAALTFDFMGAGAKPETFVAGAAFVLSSYLLGHFVFMAGSRLDRPYDRWRKRAHPFAVDKTYQAADALKKTLTPDLYGGELTTLKWARAFIQIKSAEARIEIDRLEAEQKFFRSLVVIAAMFAAHFVLRERAWFMAAIAVLMAVFSYWRYRDRRWTMTELIFATAVIVHATADSNSDAKARSGTPRIDVDDD
jgi:hypothetical protein